MDNPQVTINTVVGAVLATVTEGKHAYLQGTAVVRGIEYLASVHLYKQADGSWGVKASDGHSGYWHIVRTWSEGGQAASDSARNKILEAYSVAFTEHARCSPEILEIAEKRHVEAQIERIKAKLVEAHAVVRGLEAELAKVMGVTV